MLFTTAWNSMQEAQISAAEFTLSWQTKTEIPVQTG